MKGGNGESEESNAMPKQNKSFDYRPHT